MKKRAAVRLVSLTLSIIFFCSAAMASAGDTPRKRVALTYDDGPNGKVTQALLALLNDEQIPATFFLCAYRVRQYPELTKKIAEQGHTIGVHGSNHVQMDVLSEAEMRFELSDSINAVTEITGLRVRHFRPPYGFTNAQLEGIAAELGLNTALWNVDPEDWKYKDAQKIAASVLAQTDGESIILLHDLDMQTVYATGAIIRALRQQGYEFVTLDDF